MPTSTAPFTVLFVCTGNVCRSPLAERLGRAYLEEMLGGAAASVRLSSAGTRAVVGAPMDVVSAGALRRLGGDPTGFLAQQLQEAMATGADLTLTMTREHRGQVLARAPRALSRTFTLLEAADLIGMLGNEVDGPEGAPAERGRALVKQMAAARSARRGGDADDVADPIGQAPDVHDGMGNTVAGALLPVLGRFAAVLSAGARSA